MTNRWVSRLCPIMAEPEDVRPTGRTRNLERRLLRLNVTRPRKAIVTPTSWLARTFKVFHERQQHQSEVHSVVCPFAKRHRAHHPELKSVRPVRLGGGNPVRGLPPNYN